MPAFYDEDKFVNLSCDKDLYGHWTTLRTCIDFQMECMLLPVQFSLYMLELKGWLWMSQQRQGVSPTPRKRLHFKEQSTMTKTTKCRSPRLVSLQEKRKAVDKDDEYPNYEWIWCERNPYWLQILWHQWGIPAHLCMETAIWRVTIGWTMNLANACQ